jgi:hypothetical protein
MTGEEIDGLKLASSVCTNGTHELKRVGYRGDNARVLRLESWITDMTQAPVEGAVKISDSGRERAPHEVKGTGGVEVGAVIHGQQVHPWQYKSHGTYETSLVGSRVLSVTV